MPILSSNINLKDSEQILLVCLLSTRGWRNNGLEVTIETRKNTPSLALRYERDENI